ncbi:MAG: divalent-cation tolerance protein CutA [Steroidobacteraceae bacterium]|jgi:periplasmic divalent cation tolerance protein|nr:divalent-cation tolerance protein CutA [Steroidobacteraceae bacterium]
MPDEVIIVLSTCPDEATAARIAQALVSERLAACVNQVGGVRSCYMWNGELQQDEELLLIVKTTARALPRLQTRLEALHPYELPELVALPATDGNERYLEWVRRCVEPDGSPPE